MQSLPLPQNKRCTTGLNRRLEQRLRSGQDKCKTLGVIIELFCTVQIIHYHSARAGDSKFKIQYPSSLIDSSRNVFTAADANEIGTCQNHGVSSSEFRGYRSNFAHLFPGFVSWTGNARREVTLVRSLHSNQILNSPAARS